MLNHQFRDLVETRYLNSVKENLRRLGVIIGKREIAGSRQYGGNGEINLGSSHQICNCNKTKE